MAEAPQWAQIAIQAIIMVGGVFAGLFALVKYVLKYLEKKNGANERLVMAFNETIMNHMSHSKIAMEKVNDSQERLVRVIEKLNDKLASNK